MCTNIAVENITRDVTVSFNTLDAEWYLRLTTNQATYADIANEAGLTIAALRTRIYKFVTENNLTNVADEIQKQRDIETHQWYIRVTTNQATYEDIANEARLTAHCVRNRISKFVKKNNLPLSSDVLKNQHDTETEQWYILLTTDEATYEEIATKAGLTMAGVQARIVKFVNKRKLPIVAEVLKNQRDAETRQWYTLLTTTQTTLDDIANESGLSYSAVNTRISKCIKENNLSPVEEVLKNQQDTETNRWYILLTTNQATYADIANENGLKVSGVRARLYTFILENKLPMFNEVIKNQRDAETEQWYIKVTTNQATYEDIANETRLTVKCVYSRIYKFVNENNLPFVEDALKSQRDAETEQWYIKVTTNQAKYEDIANETGLLVGGVQSRVYRFVKEHKLPPVSKVLKNQKDAETKQWYIRLTTTQTTLADIANEVGLNVFCVQARVSSFVKKNKLPLVADVLKKQRDTETHQWYIRVTTNKATYEDIANEEGLPVSTVQQRIYRFVNENKLPNLLKIKGFTDIAQGEQIYTLILQGKTVEKINEILGESYTNTELEYRINQFLASKL